MPPTPERRAEIKAETHRRASVTARVCGLGDWIQEAYRTDNFQDGEGPILTETERAEVMETWNKGPGSMAWSGAFIVWLDEPKEEREERLARWRAAMSTVTNVTAPT